MLNILRDGSLEEGKIEKKWGQLELSEKQSNNSDEEDIRITPGFTR
ncbi:MAG: hypothetical protein J7J32_05915 [Candidatus Atribacteria bacterium]|nr:hypothetical protein [Candidatus Atribacteria bacterium]MCD6349338.1 hypothetical protein [Candidatus Atribacteria bacterium]